MLFDCLFIYLFFQIYCFPLKVWSLACLMNKNNRFRELKKDWNRRPQSVSLFYGQSAFRLLLPMEHDSMNSWRDWISTVPFFISFLKPISYRSPAVMASLQMRNPWREKEAELRGSSSVSRNIEEKILGAMWNLFSSNRGKALIRDQADQCGVKDPILQCSLTCTLPSMNPWCLTSTTDTLDSLQLSEKEVLIFFKTSPYILLYY